MTPENLRRLAMVCGYVGFLPEWNPYVNMSDAMDVMRAMREQKFSVRIPFMEQLQIEVSNRILSTPECHIRVTSIHPSAVPLYMEPQDICNAALLALDAEKEK